MWHYASLAVRAPVALLALTHGTEGIDYSAHALSNAESSLSPFHSRSLKGRVDALGRMAINTALAAFCLLSAASDGAHVWYGFPEATASPSNRLAGVASRVVPAVGAWQLGQLGVDAIKGTASALKREHGAEMIKQTLQRGATAALSLTAAYWLAMEAYEGGDPFVADWLSSSRFPQF